MGTELSVHSLNIPLVATAMCSSSWQTDQTDESDDVPAAAKVTSTVGNINLKSRHSLHSHRNGVSSLVWIHSLERTSLLYHPQESRHVRQYKPAE